MTDLLFKPIDSITFDDVVAFCATQQREDIRLDYKQELSSTDAQSQIAKVVSAMANTNGGCIIWGVPEAPGGRPGDAGIPVAKPDGMELGESCSQRIKSVCAQNIWPPIAPAVSEFLTKKPGDSRGFVVVQVAASDQIPHTVDRKSGIYIRVRDRSEPQPADIDQIAFMLRRRDQAIDLQTRLRAKQAERIRRVLNARAELMVLAIGPTRSEEPMLSLGELRAKANRLLSPPGVRDRSSPLDGGRLRSIDGGICGFETKWGTAAIADVFGNSLVGERIARPEKLENFNRHQLTQHGIEGLDTLAAPTVYPGELAMRVFVGVAAAREMIRTTGFRGQLVAQFWFLNAAKVIFGYPGPRGEVLGRCEADESLEFSMPLDTESILRAEDVQVASLPILDRIAWAWGNFAEDVAPNIALLGECWQRTANERFTNCPECKVGPCPSWRKRCLICEWKALGISTPAAPAM